jgi:hypothetical protein
VLAQLSQQVYCLEMHTVNARLLKELVRSKGEFGLGDTSRGARISVSALTKMMAGAYLSSPRMAMRERLCAYFNVAETDLFPLARKGSAKAS